MAEVYTLVKFLPLVFYLHPRKCQKIVIVRETSLKCWALIGPIVCDPHEYSTVHRATTFALFKLFGEKMGLIFLSQLSWVIFQKQVI